MRCATAVSYWLVQCGLVWFIVVLCCAVLCSVLLYDQIMCGVCKFNVFHFIFDGEEEKKEE